MIKKSLILLGLLLFLSFPSDSFARSGCCSWHGGVAYCDGTVGTYVCNDGTYSPTCGCYYNPPVVTAPAFPLDITAAWDFTANNNGTYDLNVKLKDSNSSVYSVILSKYVGADPGPLVDFYNPEFILKNVKTGRWYMNVKKSINNIWSTVAYWTIDVPVWVATPLPTSTPTIYEIPSPSSTPKPISKKESGIIRFLRLFLP